MKEIKKLLKGMSCLGLIWALMIEVWFIKWPGKSGYPRSKLWKNPHRRRQQDNFSSFHIIKIRSSDSPSKTHSNSGFKKILYWAR